MSPARYMSSCITRRSNPAMATADLSLGAASRLENKTSRKITEKEKLWYDFPFVGSCLTIDTAGKVGEKTGF
jgi:hypothetical protein